MIMTKSDADSDRELMIMISRGNERAFEQLYRRFFRKSYSLALFYLKDGQMAEDVVQEVFMDLWEGRHGLIAPDNPSAYIHVMVRNRTVKSILKRNRELIEAYELEINYQQTQDEILSGIEADNTVESLYSAIAELPPNKREICLHKLAGKLSNQEIADRMGLSIETIKTHFSQSKQMLRFKLRAKAVSLIPFILFFINRFIQK